jgi:serine protease AprX
MVQPIEDRVYFEAVPPAERSMFATDARLTSDNVQQFMPSPERMTQAAAGLQSLGFVVRHVGTFSISGEGPKELWQNVFGTYVEYRTQPLSIAYLELGQVGFWSHVSGVPFTVPESLQGLVERAYPQPPPFLFESPLPPQVSYYHLRVPDDVALILRATPTHERGVTGRGVLVVMPDTGFYRHPFYDWHGYNYQATLSPDAINVETDDVGHGTAEAANIFAVARDIDFVGVKMGGNATLAFKTASDLEPAVMTNSWGYDLPNLAILPNFLMPLEAAVIEAVRQRGITVCFAGGNGQIAFPAMMPDVLAVGGVYAHQNLVGNDFQLEASDYASSFDSLIYPGRHVPDVCGLVGMQPGAIYIELPLQPGCMIDAGLSGRAFPNRDETAPDDGWAVISGTSAASPQAAGVCALLKQAQPGLSPALIKNVLKASARDVQAGMSSTGQPAGPGYDGATGAGLMDAFAAYRLARSVTIRDVFSLPSPR